MTDKTPCPTCGKEFSNLSRHKCKKAEEAKSFSPTPTPSADFSDFPDVKEEVDKAKEKVETAQAGFTGMAGCFMTIAEWINSFWDTPPKIVCNESTAKQLSRQFYQVIGKELPPVWAFAISLFIIFGLPILAHVIGKDGINWLKKKIKGQFGKNEEKKE